MPSMFRWLIFAAALLGSESVSNETFRTWNVTILMFDEGSGSDDDCEQNDAVRRSLYRAATERAILDARFDTDPVNINVDYVSFEDDCVQSGGLLSLVRILSNRSVDAALGAVASPVCRAAVTLAQMRHKPFVSWGCVALPHVAGRRYFYRVSPAAAASARALVHVIRHFRWKQCAIVTSEEEAWLALANRLDVALREGRHIVRHFLVLPRAADRRHVRERLATVVPQVKAVILCVPLRHVRHVMDAAAELRMTAAGRHAFFAVQHPLAPPSNTTPSPFVFTYVPLNATYRDTWQAKSTFNGTENQQLFHRVYDCVALLLSVLLVRGDPPGPVRARGFLGPIVNTPDEGVKVHYVLLAYDASLRRHEALLYVRDERVALTSHSTSGLPLPDPACAFEDDEHECFQNVGADDKTTSLLHLVVILVTSAVLCTSLVCFGMLIRRMLRRRDVLKGPYGILIYPVDLEVVAPRSQAFNNAKYLSDCLEKPDLLKGSHDSLRLPVTSSVSAFEKNVAKARYKGDLVLLKYFPGRGFELRNKSIKELRVMHDLRHENVTAFIGYLVNPERPALVFDYCTRGSLQDVLSSENIKLDWAFKLSLLTDLVRGVRYLHSSPLRVHGHLTSRNCVVDARWVLKLTDYGLPAFCTSQGLPFRKPPPSELLWTAPELLRDEQSLRRGSQSGDVYSFSIIMQEVLVRGHPYCMLPLTAAEIIEKVMHPPPMIRPSVSKQAAPPEAINIMRECWAEVPDMRPDFCAIYEQFKRLNHGKKVNIVDTMFQMLEKYSNNLEEIIRERTEQLAEEKKKTEQLLHRMLPSLVAEKLKLGLPVEPEAYEEVTIYFSDIVGFTTISAYSTPMEVIDLLNDLYTCFDATINAFDVYKVETIGDAYMVVGGLPVRIDDHAAQVATMALELLHQSGKFRIQHLPFTRLKLRIGIHTGPCCAGVVGLTMPRYCLFGDTVNTASRMESTGHAAKIHISEATKGRLEQVGGYHISYRGEIELKGKGKANSYWLLGKDGFDKPLPASADNERSSHGVDEELLKQCLALPPLRTAAAGGASDAVDVEMSAAEQQDNRSSTWGAFQTQSIDSANGDGSHVSFDLGRRTLSNASEILAASGGGGSGSHTASDTQSVHSQPFPLTHPQPRKALEYIANAHSYILNMTRAHSLDSGGAPATCGRKRNAAAATTRFESQPRLPDAPHNRRSSEIWESNVKDRHARRYSNPRHFYASAVDERNGNFLTVSPPVECRRSNAYHRDDNAMIDSSLL